MNPTQLSPSAAAVAPAHAVARGRRQGGLAQGIALMGIVNMPSLALAALVPGLPQLFQQFSSVPHFQLLVPMIITVPSLCVALTSGLAGVLADRYGRRKLLLAALLAFSLLGLAPLMFDSLLLIVASRVVVGLAEAAILTVGNALMGDYFEGAQRDKWLGYQNMLSPLIGSAILLSGGLLAGLHWRYPFLLYLLGLVVFAIAWYACWEPEREREAAQPGAAAAPFPWRPTLLVCGVTVLFSMVFFVQAVQHGRIFGDMGVASPERISVFVTIASLGTVLGGYLFKRLSGVPVALRLACSMALYGVCYLGVAWAPGVSVGLPLDVLGQVGGGLLLPALIAWALQHYRFEHRGRGMGLWGGAFFLGQFLSPPLVALIATFALRMLSPALFPVFSPTLVAIGCAGYLLAIVHGAPEAKVYHAPVLRFLGTNSYCIYLTHMPVLGLMHGGLLGTAPDLATPVQGLVSVAALPVALVVGWGLTKLVEEPAMHYGRRWRWSDRLVSRQPARLAPELG